MKRIEKRPRMITYCDWCKKEITDNSHTVVRYKDKEEQHFCSVYTPTIGETCYDKHMKAAIKAIKKS